MGSDLSNDRPSREVVTRSKSYSTEELEDAKKPISSLKRSGKIHSIASKFTTDKEEAERLKNFAERQKQEEEQKAKEEAEKAAKEAEEKRLEEERLAKLEAEISKRSRRKTFS